MAQTRQAQALAPPRTSRFERLAGWAYRRRWWAIATWVVALVGVTIAAQAVAADYRNDFSLPGTKSQAALDTPREHAPVQAGATIQIVLQDPDGLAAASTRRRVEAMLAGVGDLPHVVDVRSPYTDQSAMSGDGTTGYAMVMLDGQAQDVPAADVRALMDTTQAAEGDGLRVELGGDVIRGA